MDETGLEAEREVKFSLNKGALVLAGVMLLVLIFDIQSGALATAWEAITGRHHSRSSVPALYAPLSAQERAEILSRPPQQQAERLMQAAINHDGGSLELISEQLDTWRGGLSNTPTWADLELAARNSNDLRVRSAAIEIDLIAFNLPKTEVTADLLHQAGESNPRVRPGNAYALGMLANRGVEPEKVRNWLLDWAHNPDEETRYWAVEGLALIGSDATAADLIEVLQSDPSPRVRERAAFSLVKTGMLTREQRLGAIPGLMRVADDPTLDSTTRDWVYQAMRDITEQRLGSDSAAWRDWYESHSSARLQQIRLAQPWHVPGN